MAALISGDHPPRLRIDRERMVIPGGSGPRSEIITIMNDGGGLLKGTAISDARWIHIPNPRIETPFVLTFRVEISPERITPGTNGSGKVTIITNGGSAQIFFEYIAHPEPKPVLSLDERQFQFCNIRKGEDICFDLVVRNNGSGLLSGTIESGSDWIIIKTRTIWTRAMQAVPIVVRTTQTPGVRQPVGWIKIRSSGGTEEIPISLHFRDGKGPRIRLEPPIIRCNWEIRGIIEETLIIHNEGEGILRGTIPSTVPWLKAIPSIFSTEKRGKVVFRIDTRMLPADGTQSVSIPIITNVGKSTLTIDVTPGRRIAPQVRRTRVSSRQVPRTRFTAYDSDGRMYTLLSSGKSGGEGEIYHLSGDETRCAKIFHPHRRTPETEEKIRSMIQVPPSSDLLRYLTWPEKPLTDLPKGGRVVGYLMRRITGEFRSAHLWYDELPEKNVTLLTSRIHASYHLARIVSGIHATGHVIGDLRENNLLINPHGEVILIDTDSFQITDPKTRRVFWSRVGTGEYLPPEHLDGSFAEEGCNRMYGDFFALAVLIFRFLMNGVHPFQAKGPLVRNAPATTDKIQLGYFAFEKCQPGISPPDYAPDYSRIPPVVRELFRDAFVAGHRCPSARPDPQRWIAVLKKLIPGTTNIQEKERETSPQKNENTVTSKTGYGYSDPSGNLIQIGPEVFRTSEGVIVSCQLPKTQILLNQCIQINLEQKKTKKNDSYPSSLIFPKNVLLKDGVVAGWIIPEIDPERYHLWHVIADPESRNRSGRRDFTFNRRVACCRNLLAAIISSKQMNIPCRLTERSVFVGPDASIRILCLPSEDEKKGYEISPEILVFRMLMDGYHPFHAVGKRTVGYGSHERRMKAGLYPWAESEPALSPPKHAPSQSILPEPLWTLFHQAFRDKNEDNDRDIILKTWFSVLDTVYRSLVRCPDDKSHWYLPQDSGCPWCRQVLQRRKEIPKIPIKLLPHPPIRMILKSIPISGYLMIPRGLQMSVPDESPRWNVIPLPAERVSQILLPLFPAILALPSGKKARDLPAIHVRGWLMCLTSVPIQNHGVVIGKKNKKGLSELFPDIDPLSEEVKLFCQDITLIDEMRWVSAMDRLRGEGIGQQRRRKLRTRTVSPRRKPIQVMLFPINLPWTIPDCHHPPMAGEDLENTKPPKGRKVRQKSIRGRIQTILRDFIRTDK